MLQPKPVESFPAVSVDREYTELVSDFDVDIEAVAEYLRERGLNENEIGALSIHYSASIQSRKSKSIPQRLLGVYDPKHKAIEVFRPEVLFSYNAPLAEGAKQKMRINGDTVTNEAMSTTLIHELEHYLDDTNEVHSRQGEAHRRAYVSEWRKMYLKNTGVFFVGTGALYLAKSRIGDVVADSIESTGGDANWSSIALWSAWVASAGLIGARVRRKIRNEGENMSAKAYRTSPTEIRARAAESEHTRDFMSVSAKAKEYATVQEIIALALTEAGGFDGTIDDIPPATAS